MERDAYLIHQQRSQFIKAIDDVLFEKFCQLADKGVPCKTIVDHYNHEYEGSMLPLIVRMMDIKSEDEILIVNIYWREYLSRKLKLYQVPLKEGTIEYDFFLPLNILGQVAEKTGWTFHLSFDDLIHGNLQFLFAQKGKMIPLEEHEERVNQAINICDCL